MFCEMLRAFELGLRVESSSSHSKYLILFCYLYGIKNLFFLKIDVLGINVLKIDVLCIEALEINILNVTVLKMNASKELCTTFYHSE